MKKSKSNEDKSIFSFQDYRSYTLHRIQSEADNWGYQGKLAEAARCQPSYFSQALKGRTQLGADQLAGLASFWQLNQDEKSYLIHLMLLEKASHPELKLHCSKRLEELRTKQENLAKRLAYPSLVRLEDEAIYYSSWLYPAIHIATSIPQFQSVDPLAREFGINTAHVLKILEQLLQMGLVERCQTNVWKLTGKFLHLSNSSSFFALQHMNWRFRCVDHLQKNPQEGLHVSSVFSVSKTDIPRIEEEIRSFVEKIHMIVGESKEEEVVCMTCDLFKVTK